MIVFVAHTDNCLSAFSSYKEINVCSKLYAARLVVFVKFSFCSILLSIHRPVDLHGLL